LGVVPNLGRTFSMYGSRVVFSIVSTISISSSSSPSKSSSTIIWTTGFMVVSGGLIFSLISGGISIVKAK